MIADRHSLSLITKLDNLTHLDVHCSNCHRCVGERELLEVFLTGPNIQKLETLIFREGFPYPTKVITSEVLKKLAKKCPLLKTFRASLTFGLPLDGLYDIITNLEFLTELHVWDEDLTFLKTAIRFTKSNFLELWTKNNCLTWRADQQRLQIWKLPEFSTYPKDDEELLLVFDNLDFF